MDVLHAVFGAASSWLPVFLLLATACAGAYVLIDGPRPARVACGVAYAWNPFVFDRLAVGQLSVLAGYAVLPWLLTVAVRADKARSAVVAGALWALAASCTVHYVWIGGVLVLAVVLVRRRELGPRVWMGALIVSVVMFLAVAAWIVTQHAHREPGGPAVLTTFGTATEGTLGRSFGLLAEQGFWRTVVRRPASDLGPAFAFVAAAVVGVAGLGLLASPGTRRARAALAVTMAGFAGWILAHGAAGPAGAAYRFAFDHLPWFGIMREAQKWDALVCLAIAFGLGGCAAAITQTRMRRAAWLVALLPIALAPTLAWGLAGRVETSHYPQSWSAVRASFDAMPGEIVALPWTQYVLPGITGNRNIVDPLASYFGTRVLTSRDAGVPGLAGDTSRRATIAAAVRDAQSNAAAGRPVHLGAALRDLGIRGLLALGADDTVMLRRDPDLTVRAVGDHVVLFAVVSPR